MYRSSQVKPCASQDVRLADLGNEGCVHIAEGLKQSQVLFLELFEKKIYIALYIDLQEIYSILILYSCLGRKMSGNQRKSVENTGRSRELSKPQEGVAKALQHLDLSYNQIYDGGGLALAEALRCNKTLHDLLLRTNQLGDAGGKCKSRPGSKLLSPNMHDTRYTVYIYAGGKMNVNDYMILLRIDHLQSPWAIIWWFR